MSYKAIIHYHFKKGLEEEGILFLENEVLKNAKKLGCHDIEILQNEMDATYVVAIGLWNNVEEARKFQSVWTSKENKLVNQFCTNAPEREFYTIRNSYHEKRKAA